VKPGACLRVSRSGAGTTRGLVLHETLCWPSIGSASFGIAIPQSVQKSMVWHRSWLLPCDRLRWAIIRK
jgi:hypothetical protein